MSAKSGHGQVCCTFCEKVISKEAHIDCAECPDVYLCLECFAAGVETPTHRNCHSYRVVTQQRFPLYTNDWTAEEEVALLQAIQIFGLGNFRTIAQRLPSRTAQECEQHYFQTYIQCASAPYPEPVWKAIPATAGSQRATNVAASSRDEHVKAKYRPALPASFAGYRLRRQDYDVEALDSAEDSLTDIVFYPDDAPLDRKFKLALVQIYNKRLHKRMMRHRFATMYKLNDPLVLSKLGIDKNIATIVAKLRPFARFHTPQDHLQLLNALARRIKLQQQIVRLQTCRRHGCRTEAEVKALDESGLLQQAPQQPVRRSKQLQIRALQELPHGELLSSKELETCLELQLVPSQYMECLHAAYQGSPMPSYLTPSTQKGLSDVFKAKGVVAQAREDHMQAGDDNDSTATVSE